MEEGEWTRDSPNYARRSAKDGGGGGEERSGGQPEKFGWRGGGATWRTFVETLVAARREAKAIDAAY